MAKEVLPPWLPPKLESASYSSTDELLSAAYDCFREDFVVSSGSLLYNGILVRLPRLPSYDGFHETFLHIVSQEKKNIHCRLYDSERCSRIPWIKPIIENNHEATIKKWKNRRKGNNRHLLWLESAEYLVVLTRRKREFLLWTAYVVNQSHSKRKLTKEYQNYLNQRRT